MNLVVIMGNLGQDPEIKYFESGKVKTSFSVGVSEYAGEGKDYQTTWFKCEAWNKTAEIVGEYFKQGDKISIEGSGRVDEWEDDNGVKKSRFYVKVNKIHFTQKKEKPPETPSMHQGVTEAVQRYGDEEQTKMDYTYDSDVIGEEEIPF